MNAADQLVREKGLKIFNRFSSGVFCTDTKKRIIYANPAFCRIYKISQKDVLNKTCHSILHPNVTDCSYCWKKKFLHLQTEIGGKKSSVLISSSLLSPEIFLSIIHNITVLLAETDVLKEQISELKLYVESTIGAAGPMVVCCQCHKIRLKDGSWVPPRNVEAVKLVDGLSHGNCPSCSRKWLEELTSRCDDMQAMMH